QQGKPASDLDRGGPQEERHPERAPPAGPPPAGYMTSMLPLRMKIWPIKQTRCKCPTSLQDADSPADRERPPAAPPSPGTSRRHPEPTGTGCPDGFHFG